MPATNKYSDTLFIVKTDMDQKHVIVGSNHKDPKVAHAEVNSNDAIDFALDAARDAGMTRPQQHGSPLMTFYDTKKKKLVNDPRGMSGDSLRQVTIVDVLDDAPSSRTYVGDSISG